MAIICICAFHEEKIVVKPVCFKFFFTSLNTISLLINNNQTHKPLKKKTKSFTVREYS